MRQLMGLGTPRGLQGRLAVVIATLLMLVGAVRRRVVTISALHRCLAASLGLMSVTTLVVNSSAVNLPRFNRHPISLESAIGVCHGETEAAVVLGGV